MDMVMDMDMAMEDTDIMAMARDLLMLKPLL